MSDDLHERDVLAWSINQAALLRRVAAGERVNTVDWVNVVEEIEDLGISELNAVRSYLRQILVHLLKLHAWPGHDAARHWRSEVIAFQSDAAQRFAPSMRQRIELEKIHARAVRQVEPLYQDGVPVPPPPASCPVTLDQVLNASCRELEAAFAATPGA